MTKNAEYEEAVQQFFLSQFEKLDALLTRLDEALAAADDELAESLIQEIEPIVTRLDALHQTVALLPDCQSPADKCQ